jgi:hypothetical protein
MISTNAPAEWPPNPLGARIEWFGPWQANLVAGRILSIVLPLFGLFGSATMVSRIARDARRIPAGQPGEWILYVSIAVFIAGGLIFLYWGIHIFRYTSKLASHEVELFENGLRRRFEGYVTILLWSEVVRVVETVSYERPPILTFPTVLLVPEFASRSYGVVAKGGTIVEFDGNHIKLLKRFSRLLREQTNRLGIPWDVHHLHVPPA